MIWTSETLINTIQFAKHSRTLIFHCRIRFNQLINANGLSEFSLCFSVRRMVRHVHLMKINVVNQIQSSRNSIWDRNYFNHFQSKHFEKNTHNRLCMKVELILRSILCVRVWLESCVLSVKMKTAQIGVKINCVCLMNYVCPFRN